MPFLPALARRRFRLAGWRIDFSVWRWVSYYHHTALRDTTLRFACMVLLALRACRLSEARRGRDMSGACGHAVGEHGQPRSGCMSVARYGNGFHHRRKVRMRGSRRGNGCGRGDRMVRRETRILSGRACARDCSGYGRRFVGFLPPLAPLKGGIIKVLWPVLPAI